MAALAATASATAPADSRDSRGAVPLTRAVHQDAIGDAGRAPDIARVTMTPVAGGLAVDVKLAKPTEFGTYGSQFRHQDLRASPAPI